MRRYKFDAGFDIFEEHPKGDLVDYDDALALIRATYDQAWAESGTYITQAMLDRGREEWIRRHVTGEGK